MAARSKFVFCFVLLAGILVPASRNNHRTISEPVSAFLPSTDHLHDDAVSAISGMNKGVVREQVNLERNRKEAVLSLIHYSWEDLGFKVVFKGARRGYRAMTLTDQKRIEVYARPGDGAMMQAFDLAHELGHAFDLKNNDDDRRRTWCELRGIDPSTPWFGCDACSDYGTPAGDFAETFAYLLLGPGSFHSKMAPAPKAAQVPALAKFCNIEHIAKQWVPDLHGTNLAQ